jgi:hypothetical protein
MALYILIGYLLACGAIYWDSQRHRRICITNEPR